MFCGAHPLVSKALRHRRPECRDASPRAFSSDAARKVLTAASAAADRFGMQVASDARCPSTLARQGGAVGVAA